MRSTPIINSFLAHTGASKPASAGGDEPRSLTPEELQELLRRLREVARRSASMAWFLVIGIFAITVAGFIVTSATGGTLGLVSGGFTTMLILPIGGFLRSIWQEKYRVEVFLELFPLLSPMQQNEGLVRFVNRDAST